MFCKYCGTENIEGAKFCVNCGAQMAVPTEATPDALEQVVTAQGVSTQIPAAAHRQRGIAAILGLIAALLVAALVWKAASSTSSGETIMTPQPRADEAIVVSGDPESNNDLESNEDPSSNDEAKASEDQKASDGQKKGSSKPENSDKTEPSKSDATASSTRVEVPNLVGKPQAEAEKALNERGLVGRNDGSVYNDNVPLGCVVSQSPKAGSSSEKGAEVVYKLSKGKEYIEVPNVVGYHYVTATAMLEERGFSVSTEYEENTAVEENYVIRQSATGMAERGATVVITVSLGAPPEPKNLLSDWSGTYEGRTDDDEVIWRPFTLRFDTIGYDGTLVGVCRVEVNDDPKKPMAATFRVEGKVNWRTDEMYVYGTAWIDEGALSDLSNFEGVIDYSANTMSGVTWIEGEEPERTWSAAASDTTSNPFQNPNY